MINTSNVKIDMEKMCIDRNTNLGKQFEALNKRIAETEDVNEREFMQQMTAYAEAAIIIENVCKPEDAAVKIKQLVAQMDGVSDTKLNG